MLRLGRRDLIIVTSGGLAREIADAAVAVERYRVVGVVDDDPSAWDERREDDLPLLGGLERVVEDAASQLVIAAARGTSRRSVVRKLMHSGVDPERFVSIVHPSAVMGSRSVVESGGVLLAGAVMTTDVRVGPHVVVMPNAVLSHDVVVGEFATVGAGVVLAGDVTVGADAFVAAGVAVRDSCTIGAEATVVLGSVVVRDIPAGETWGGNPATQMRLPDARAYLRSEARDR